MSVTDVCGLFSFPYACLPPPFMSGRVGSCGAAGVARPRRCDFLRGMSLNFLSVRQKFITFALFGYY